MSYFDSMKGLAVHAEVAGAQQGVSSPTFLQKPSHEARQSWEERSDPGNEID